MSRLRTTSCAIAVSLILSACSSNSTPATAPATTRAPTTTTVAPTTTSTTTTTAAPTTTVDRKAEIEAIFQDLEQRRLTALYEGDEEAFRALFANEAYLQEDLASFDLVVFVDEPTSVKLDVVEVVFDSDECVAAVVEADYSAFLPEGAPSMADFVVELVDDKWGYSFVGEGWRCEGPHPLEP